jgi:hypothetical protein
MTKLILVISLQVRIPSHWLRLANRMAKTLVIVLSCVILVVEMNLDKHRHNVIPKVFNRVGNLGGFKGRDNNPTILK